MNDRALESLPEDMKDVLRRHTKLDANKVVSYLPLSTIENVMRISLGTYTAIIESNRGSYIVFGENECRISSGAVYAFLPEELSGILKANKDILTSASIPCEPWAFIRTIADTWFEDGAAIMPLIKKLFGEG